MPRTDADAVKEVMAAGEDYDLDRAPSLARYITTANLVVTRVIACAVAKGITVTDAEAETMETWLAAYFYTRSDPIYQSKSTGGQSASFVNDGLKSGGSRSYRDGATAVDPSGCLDTILSGVTRARVAWLGKTVPEQLDWDARN